MNTASQKLGFQLLVGLWQFHLFLDKFNTRKGADFICLREKEIPEGYPFDRAQL